MRAESRVDETDHTATGCTGRVRTRQISAQAAPNGERGETLLENPDEEGLSKENYAGHCGQLLMPQAATTGCIISCPADWPTGHRGRVCPEQRLIRSRQARD